MAAARMPAAFFELVEHHLPPERPVGPEGGRPAAGQRVVMDVLRFVPATGCRWEDVPPGPGRSGTTARRHLRLWEEMGVWDRPHADLPRLPREAGRLDPDLVIVDAVILRAFGGGELTGPGPVDRRKKGGKHTLPVDRHGTPSAIRTAGANASGHTQVIPIVLDFPRVPGKPGRPKGRPDEPCADRGHDSDATRWLLAWLGIGPHVARRGTPHGGGLGKIRWVVGRTISWLKGLRRMRVRHDRPRVVQEAWNTPAVCVICFRMLHDEDTLTG